MTAQGLVVAILVVGCSFGAAWTLMPSAARRALALQLLKLPLPPALSRALRRASQAASGCGCDGCDHSASKPRGVTPQPVTFHVRKHR